MPGIPGWPDDYNPYPFDVAKAKTDLAKAMDDMGISNDPAVLKPAAKTDTCDDACQLYTARVHSIGRMKFGYNCNAGHLPRVAFLAEAWRTTLKLTESTFDISCTDFPTLLQERPAGKYSIARDGWNADFPHAKNQLDLLTCGSGNNSSQYCNPAFDAAFNEAATIADPAQQTAKYIEAQRLAVDDAPVLFLRYATVRYLIQPYVTGVAATPTDSQNVGDRLLETIQILAH
jgi:ABC-type oligopeptide transport system substrate-binding subunit